jgi:hypothetical protein
LSNVEAEQPSELETVSKYVTTKQQSKDAAAATPAHSLALYESYAYPTVAQIAGESVQVNSPEEAAEAQAIIATIRHEYGIELSSQKGIDGLRQQYDQVPAAVKNQVRTTEWQLKELRAIRRSLQHFAPLLGKQREKSATQAIPQQVISMSKLTGAVTDNAPDGHLDGKDVKRTNGEYFAQARNVSLFSAATGNSIDGMSNEKSLEATLVHELAHGLLGYRMVDFVASVGYWTTGWPPKAIEGAERPPTPRGYKSPDEDWAESVKWFFTKRQSLSDNCPKRYEFLKNEVDSWHGKERKNPSKDK